MCQKLIKVEAFQKGLEFNIEFFHIILQACDVCPNKTSSPLWESTILCKSLAHKRARLSHIILYYLSLNQANNPTAEAAASVRARGESEWHANFLCSLGPFADHHRWYCMCVGNEAARRITYLHSLNQTLRGFRFNNDEAVSDLFARQKLILIKRDTKWTLTPTHS